LATRPLPAAQVTKKLDKLGFLLGSQIMTRKSRDASMTPLAAVA
jgi:hypothetical protein